ncbi:hypothetical protein FQA39_LY17745 [Lamprigera yunnana]|nr:hypothetical protein FQA39_LY17745 [Lamprigera yunnana]
MRTSFNDNLAMLKLKVIVSKAFLFSCEKYGDYENVEFKKKTEDLRQNMLANLDKQQLCNTDGKTNVSTFIHGVCDECAVEMRDMYFITLKNRECSCDRYLCIERTLKTIWKISLSVETENRNVIILTIVCVHLE